MKSTWLRGPIFGPIQGSLGVLCLTLLATATGCGTENQSGAVGESGTNAAKEDSTANAVPWGPDEDCRAWGCAETPASQSAMAPTANVFQACTSSAECGSGFCVDGVCCDSACTGTCQACSAAKKGQGADGTCGSITLYGDPDNECAQGACNGSGSCQKYNGATCSVTNECLSGNCADGFCCGNACSGPCMACSVAKRGSGVNGQCGAIAANTDPDNECTAGECNGSGTCTSSQLAANGAACTAGAQCSSGNCVDGVCCDSACTGSCQACSAAKKFQGSDGTCGPIAATKNPDGECSGGYCNGSSACIHYNGAACSTATQCMSGYCVDGVCCGNACTGTCMACTAAKRGTGVNGQCGPIAANTDPDNECTNAECSGSSSCNLAQGSSNGSACSQSAQCASGFCADGVCCDSACTGLCNACSAAKKGQGADGSCGPIAVNKDPDNECAQGACSGASTCKFYNGATCGVSGECLSGYCVDNVCCGNACNGPCMACTAAKRGTGFNGQCGLIASGSDPDNECGGAGVCSGSNACTMVDTGFACGTNAECSSGFCVDGVCCASACSGTCMACNVAGSAGTCSPVPQGQSDANSTPVCAGICDGQGMCQSNSGSACTTGLQCLSHVCDDEVCANVAAPNAPLQWATILSPTTNSTIDIDWLTPLANGGIAGSGAKTGSIDMNGWLLTADPSREQPWSFSFDATGSPTDVSDSAINDADNETTFLRARARYADIVVTRHWYHGNGDSVYTSTIDAGSWTRTFNDTEVTSLTAGDGGHTLVAATVSPDNLAGIDFGDGNLVLGDRLVKYDPTGAVVFNVASGLSLGSIIDPAGDFYSVSRQAGVLNIVKQDGQGNPAWSKAIAATVGGNVSPAVASVFDETGNMYVAFNFNGSVNFGNGAMNAVGVNDLGFVKLSPAGNVIWTKQFGTSTFNLVGVYMDFTGPDDAIVIGYFSGTANLGAGNFTGGSFLAKFDETGTLVWRGAPPSSWYALTGAPNGSVFVGATSQTSDFGWGAPLAGTGGLVVVKYGN